MELISACPFLLSSLPLHSNPLQLEDYVLTLPAASKDNLAIFCFTHSLKCLPYMLFFYILL